MFWVKYLWKIIKLFSHLEAHWIYELTFYLPSMQGEGSWSERMWRCYRGAERLHPGGWPGLACSHQPALNPTRRHLHGGESAPPKCSATAGCAFLWEFCMHCNSRMVWVTWSTVYIDVGLWYQSLTVRCARFRLFMSRWPLQFMRSVTWLIRWPWLLDRRPPSSDTR